MAQVADYLAQDEVAKWEYHCRVIKQYQCNVESRVFGVLMHGTRILQNSQNMQAAKRCQLDVLHGRRHERAVGGFYPTAFSSGCLRKRPSNLLQTFALQNISGCKIM